MLPTMTTVLATLAASCVLAAHAAPRAPHAQNAPAGQAPGGASGAGQDASAPAAAPATGATKAPRAYDSPWPQSATKDGIVYTVDKPSFTSVDGAQVKMTAPLQVTMDDGSMMSGSVEVSATIAPSDKDGDVELNRMVVVSASLDGADDTAKVQAALNTLLEKAALTVARATIVQDMDIEPVTTPGLSHAPPVIRVVEKPTVLLSIDGPPHSLPLGSTGWRYVTNTPFIVLLDPNSSWFLRLGQSDWRGARMINGPWQPVPAPPVEVVATLGTPPQLPPDVQRDQANAAKSQAATKAAVPPDVLVATQPTVLISLNGPPQLAAVCDGVQGASNTNGVLLRTAAPDQWWTLASGRWFAAAALSGPWTYVAPGDLPKAFANLPATGQYTGALASVPNTTAAKEAVLANAEMRTVTIERAQATCGVTIQGQPNLAPIGGTALLFVTNASLPLVKSGQTYYCCDSAAWFSAPNVSGPWTLCDAVPDDVYKIPPSCPIFACTFVEVLGSTATSVSFGFTPGYMGTYMQDGTVVYGTGYAYKPADLGGGATQTYPTTYGSDPGYDPDSGTFAPPTADTYIDSYPAVQPIYLSSGYCGWGWCGGWTSSWGYGWGNWGYWNHWDRYWNNWHPYNNHWNQNWNQWHQGQYQAQQSRQNLANRGLANANNWNRATRTPGGQIPTNNPGGERPTQYPGGQRPTEYPGGERPTEYPGGQRPTEYPGGERPTQYPGGERPTEYPGGQRPTQYPGGQIPTRYPTSRAYGGSESGGGGSQYSGFHEPYHSQAGAYGGGARAPQYGNAYRGGGQVRGSSGGGARGGGGGRR